MSSLPQTGGKPQGSSTPIRITVDENSSETVINLGTLFGAMSGLHNGGGLKLSIVGNTNAGLVKTDLSGTTLTLTYPRGQCGTATITVGATDADGVSVQQTFLVTVQALRPAGAVYVSPLLAGVSLPMSSGTWR